MSNNQKLSSVDEHAAKAVAGARVWVKPTFEEEPLKNALSGPDIVHHNDGVNSS